NTFITSITCRYSMTNIKYYSPSDSLVEYLNLELQNLEDRNNDNDSGEGNKVYKRKEKSRNRISKRKFDNIEHIFKAFADVIYFLEFIEYNYDKLNGIYEDVLKDLFGYNKDYIGDSKLDSRSFYHYRNLDGPLIRLVNAILLINKSNRSSKLIDRLDFRTTLLSKIFLDQTFKALEARIIETEERYMMSNDVYRLRFWGNYLAKQVNDKEKASTRRIKLAPLE
ncbi:MAG: hypothetical protein L0H55_13705, partial [Candidatus Nitrosocosmicus sp.]|nr:hypothetical protein [Candidatus Nitrosocosmicus sp.]